MNDGSSDLAQRVREGLTQVIDPELGLDVVKLGLIYSVESDEKGAVRITMTTTTAGCPAAGFLVDGVRHATTAVAGVHSVDVHLTYEPHWRPEMMTD